MFTPQARPVATPIFRSWFVSLYPAKMIDDAAITWSWGRALRGASLPALSALLLIMDVDRTVTVVVVIATAVMLFSGVALHNHRTRKHKREHGPS